MAKSVQFMKAFEDRIKSSIRTFMPGQIVSFDNTNQEADVQPLYLENLFDEDMPGKMPMLESVPVISFNLYQEDSGESTAKVFKQSYKRGDVVFIAICDRDIDELQKKPFAPDSKKKFSLKDAVIIGGWNL